MSFYFLTLLNVNRKTVDSHFLLTLAVLENSKAYSSLIVCPCFFHSGAGKMKKEDMDEMGGLTGCIKSGDVSKINKTVVRESLIDIDDDFCSDADMQKEIFEVTKDEVTGRRKRATTGEMTSTDHIYK